MIDRTLVDKIEKIQAIAGSDYVKAFASLELVMETRKKTAQFMLSNSLTEEDQKILINQMDYLNDLIKKTLSL